FSLLVWSQHFNFVCHFPPPDVAEMLFPSGKEHFAYSCPWPCVYHLTEHSEVLFCSKNIRESQRGNGTNLSLLKGTRPSSVAGVVSAQHSCMSQTDLCFSGKLRG
uniref:Uncharacterized protein n=1 Tax=Otus sunia TaxID=257818 RepID=A0A8C8ADE1_9STRI